MRQRGHSTQEGRTDPTGRTRASPLSTAVGSSRRSPYADRFCPSRRLPRSSRHTGPVDPRGGRRGHPTEHGNTRRHPPSPCRTASSTPVKAAMRVDARRASPSRHSKRLTASERFPTDSHRPRQDEHAPEGCPHRWGGGVVSGAGTHRVGSVGVPAGLTCDQPRMTRSGAALDRVSRRARRHTRSKSRSKT